MQLKTNRSFLVVLLLTLITFGIYGLFFTHSVIKDVNIACEKDGKHTTGLLALFFFGLITFGIYSLVWIILLIMRLENFAIAFGQEPDVTILSFLLWFLLGSFIIIGPFVAGYKHIKGINQVCTIFNNQKK